MKHLYPRIQDRFCKAQGPRKLLLRKLLLPLMMILIISITTTFAQEGQNYIYLSGQLTNIENGAPISGHAVYVESNSESSGGGINYYLAAYTDAYGFFTDTINTASLDGSLMIYTFDENSGEYVKEEYYRFNWASEYNMVTELAIVDSSSLTDFQANFESEKDEIDSLHISFADESIGEGVVSWLWEFGDGTSSIERNPVHVYDHPGVYNVKLTVSTEPIIHDVRTSTMVKKVKAGLRDYYHFGGHAFAGWFPVDIGTAYLYKVEDDEFIPVDTTEFDQYGFYDFPQLIEGSYKVKTFPSTNSVNAGDFFPTYFGDAILWTKSKTIELYATGWEYDINMVASYEYETGNGVIDGVVTLDGTDNPPLQNTEVILFNEEDNNLTYLKSDDEGYFEFIELPFGTYKVMAEVPGLFTYPITIELNADNPFIENLNILVYQEEMPFSINDNIQTSLSGLSDPYPNPAKDHTQFEFSLKQNAIVHVFILNNNGQVVQKQSGSYMSGNHNIKLNIPGLSEGIYRIMVLVGNEKHVKPFIKIN